MAEASSSLPSSSSYDLYGNWNAVIGDCMERADKEGLLDVLHKAKGMEDKMGKLQDCFWMRRKMAAFVSQLCENAHGKNGGEASKLRDQGNAKFAAKDDADSIKLYTLSLIEAPEVGPELSLAFANRSAVLYHLKKYAEAVDDIALAFKYRYPKNLHYKIFQRRGQCLTALGRHVEAEAALTEAIASLEYGHKMPENKKDSLTRDLNALIAETRAVAERTGRWHPTGPKLVEPEELKAGKTFKQLLDTDITSSTELRDASLSIALRNDEVDGPRGRHIVAVMKQHKGALLFQEAPFASVLAPEFYSTRCHNCYDALALSPIPCLKCTQPRYCSDECRASSWHQYHQYECHGLDFLHSVGIAHLALRTLLVSGRKRVLALKPFLRKDDSLSLVGAGAGQYVRVVKLMHHADKMSKEEMFQYAATAALLTMFVEQKTNFLKDSKEAEQRAVSSGGSEESDNLSNYIGALLLRHILQLICNASAIQHVLPDEEPTHNINNGSSGGGGGGSISSTETLSQTTIATALYCSVSMMNHSCEPNVMSSFYKSKIIVRAIRDIDQGEEVFNCYGPHIGRHPIEHRRKILESQYHFSCHCHYCEIKPSFEETFFALKCGKCHEPIGCRSAMLLQTDALPDCLICNAKIDAPGYQRLMMEGDAAHATAVANLRRGCNSEAVTSLNECLVRWTKIMHRYNEELMKLHDVLARVHFDTGDPMRSMVHIRSVIEIVKNRYGEDSIELGNELSKMVGVSEAMGGDSGLNDEYVRFVYRGIDLAASIYEIHYGPWNETTRDLRRKRSEYRKTHGGTIKLD